MISPFPEKNQQCLKYIDKENQDRFVDMAKPYNIGNILIITVVWELHK